MSSSAVDGWKPGRSLLGGLAWGGVDGRGCCVLWRGVLVVLGGLLAGEVGRVEAGGSGGCCWIVGVLFMGGDGMRHGLRMSRRWHRVSDLGQQLVQSSRDV